MDLPQSNSAYDRLTRPQQKALVDWAVREIKNPESVYYGTSFSQLCESVAADEGAIRALMKGVEPTLLSAPRRDSGFAKAFIDATVKQTMQDYLARLERGEVPGVKPDGIKR